MTLGVYRKQRESLEGNFMRQEFFSPTKGLLIGKLRQNSTATLITKGVFYCTKLYHVFWSGFYSL